MRYPRCGLRSAPGFTLIEMVVTIVITAIVASFIAMFLDTPIESYFAQTRRSALVDSADRIADAVTADVRTALPNSLRVTNTGGVYALELLATDTTQPTVRYYGTGDDAAGRTVVQYAPHKASSFSTLDMFNLSATSSYTTSDLLSIGNLGIAGFDAYATVIHGNAQDGVMTLAGNTLTIAPQSPPGTEDLVTLNSQKALFESNGQTDRNAYLVTGPVSYVCDPVSSGDAHAGTMMKYTGYGVMAAQQVPPAGGTAALIAQNVTGCSIYTEFAQDTSYNFGEIAVLTVTLSNSGESFQVFLEAATKYDQ